jgi:hypothetical protein
VRCSGEVGWGHSYNKRAATAKNKKNKVSKRESSMSGFGLSQPTSDDVVDAEAQALRWRVTSKGHSDRINFKPRRGKSGSTNTDYGASMQSMQLAMTRTAQKGARKTHKDN